MTLQRRTPLNPGTKGLAPGKPLQRGKPLARGGGLTQAGSLNRSAGLARGGPLPARRPGPARTTYRSARGLEVHDCCGEAEGKRIVRERSIWCEICGLVPAREASHRKAEGRGGCWCPSNLLHVCGHGNADGCHGRVHADEEGEATRFGWVVPTGLDPSAVAVVLALHGRELEAFLLVDGSLSLTGREVSRESRARFSVRASRSPLADSGG